MFQLLCVEPGARVSSLQELRQVPCLRHLDFDAILEKQTKPRFTPPVRKFYKPNVSLYVTLQKACKYK